jgi:maltose alpha-D-glucosyltransferase/alpha-amylase
MQWSDEQNAGFSTGEKDQLYLPVDPRKNRPTVKKQTGNPGSLLNHIRKLIALRRSAPALQAVGTFVPLQVEKNDHHFAYLRQSGSERFLIMLNPSAESSIVSTKGIRPDNLVSQISHGIQACIEGDDIQFKLEGVSYGIFML